MDIERLSNSQLLLLTLLVAFVTSIATGVLTVSLLDEAPETVTQTVNRVVERTVERVAPAGEEQGAAAITTERTVVVKEEDVIPETVAGHAPLVVQLHAGTTTTPAFGVGLYLPQRGLVATAENVFASREVGNTLLAFNNGTVRATTELFVTDTTDIGLLNIIGDETSTPLPSVSSPEFVGPESISRGQSVLTLTQRGAVRTGIVSLVEGTTVETSLERNAVPFGGALLSTFGEILGLHVLDTEGSGAQFVSAQELLKALAAYDALGA